MTVLNSNKPNAWQTALAHAITDPAELLALLELDPSLLDAAKSAATLFPLKVPRGFVARMQKRNINDPLLKQILPLDVEWNETPGFSRDPLREANVNPAPGLLHKYKNRVLLTLVGTCAVNCRFCFRRHFPYESNNPGREGWEQTLQYVATNPAIDEVILSGGDPLVVSDKLLQFFSEQLNAIPHVKRLRIHTRIPIVLPERITPEFLAWARGLKQKLVIVMHCNHPQEIDATVVAAMAALRAAGVTLLNQTVLLKGINDSVETLATLSETLFAADILPYYIHLLDKVQGAAHFDLSEAEARELHHALNQRSSGYLVPRLVYEKAGAPSKVSVDLYTD